MDKIKNYAIAILTGLLALSLFTQPAQSAPAKSKEAKAVEYLVCMNEVMEDGSRIYQPPVPDTVAAANLCAKLRP